mgnify:CR=1 FL=1
MTTPHDTLNGPFLEDLPLPERFPTEEALDDFLAVPSQDLVRDMARTEGDLMILGVGGKMGPTLARIESSAQAVERMAEVAGKASTRAGAAADAAATSVQQLGSETLPELARLMAELNQLSASLRQLSEQTTVSPSSLLLGRPAPTPGPGESPP